MRCHAVVASFASLLSFVSFAPLVLFPAAALAQHDHAEPHRHDRRFTFIDESQHGAEPGDFELENVVTWRRGTRDDSGLDRFEFKHELEYGISDTVIFAVDLAEWRTTEESGEWHTKFDMVGAELKFRLANPRTDCLGLGFKTEIGVGSRELEWENVLIVDKTIDEWQLVYNLKLEAEAEGDESFHYSEAELAVDQALGASYELSPQWLVGGEFLYQIPPEWDWGDRQNFFVGPNASFRGDGFAITTTALFLADGTATEPEFQLRLLFEFEF
jgi:hypothetical protein